MRNESRRASRPAPQDLRTGSPATEIVAGATSWGADLIAMATHGCGGLGRFLFGSIAEAVLRTAPQPVLMIRTAAKAAARAGEARP